MEAKAERSEPTAADLKKQNLNVEQLEALYQERKQKEAQHALERRTVQTSDANEAEFARQFNLKNIDQDTTCTRVAERLYQFAVGCGFLLLLVAALQQLCGTGRGCNLSMIAKYTEYQQRLLGVIMVLALHVGKSIGATALCGCLERYKTHTIHQLLDVLINAVFPFILLTAFTIADDLALTATNWRHSGSMFANLRWEVQYILMALLSIYSVFEAVWCSGERSKRKNLNKHLPRTEPITRLVVMVVFLAVAISASNSGAHAHMANVLTVASLLGLLAGSLGLLNEVGLLLFYAGVLSTNYYLSQLTLRAGGNAMHGANAFG
jgi:hypothetical protein